MSSIYHQLRCDCNPSKVDPYSSRDSFERHFNTQRHKAYEYSKLLPEHHQLQVRLDITKRQRDVALTRVEGFRMQNRVLERLNERLQTEIQTERRQKQQMVDEKNRQIQTERMQRQEATDEKNRLMTIISGIQNVITTQNQHS